MNRRSNRRTAGTMRDVRQRTASRSPYDRLGWPDLGYPAIRLSFPLSVPFRLPRSPFIRPLVPAIVSESTLLRWCLMPTRGRDLQPLAPPFRGDWCSSPSVLCEFARTARVRHRIMPRRLSRSAISIGFDRSVTGRRLFHCQISQNLIVSSILQGQGKKRGPKYGSRKRDRIERIRKRESSNGNFETSETRLCPTFFSGIWLALFLESDPILFIYVFIYIYIYIYIYISLDISKEIWNEIRKRFYSHKSTIIYSFDYKSF